MSTYTPVSVPCPASATAGAAVKVSPRSTIAVGLSGTFVATVQIQWSPEKTGDVWNNLGSALTAAAYLTLPAGHAQRIRANVTAYTSGTPVVTMIHDTALHAKKIERTFDEQTLNVATSVAAGTPLTIEDGEQGIVQISGTFVATLQVQVSLSAAGDDWFDWSVPIVDAAGYVILPRGSGARLRINTTGYTSGTPVAKYVSGFSAEDVIDDKPESVSAAGALSLLTRISLLTISGTKAYTLADGLFEGQQKIVIVVSAVSTPVGTLTIATYADGSSEVFSLTGEVLILEWHVSGGWRKIVRTAVTALDWRFPGTNAFTCIDFGGAASDTETIVIGTETYVLKTAGIVNPFEFTGGTANAQAVSLGAVINSDGAQGLTAVVVGDSVFVFADAVGTAYNLTVTNNLTNVTADNVAGGLNPARKQMTTLKHTVTASEVAAGEVHVPLPFAPRVWDWKLYTSAGVEKVDGTNAESYDGAITAETAPNRLKFAVGTNLLMAATDVLFVTAWD
jgi:hypothetical protein